MAKLAPNSVPPPHNMASAEHTAMLALQFSRWQPDAEKCRALQAASTLLLLDFDCTLAAHHMWKTLRTAEGEAAASSDPAAFYLRIFGGAQRLDKCASFLRAVRATGTTVAILSNGYEAEIRAALEQTGLAELFDQVFGAESQDEAGCEDKPGFVARLCITAATQAKPFTHVLFADDDRSNYPGEHEGNVDAGDVWVLESDESRMAMHLPPEVRAQLPPLPATRMVAWPAGEGEGAMGGLTPVDFDGIVAALGQADARTS